MLNYTVMSKFFEKNPEGYINIIQSDCNFRITKDVPYMLDVTSITLLDITYTDKKCGNFYVRQGKFIIPFNQILRIEYIKRELES